MRPSVLSFPGLRGRPAGLVSGVLLGLVCWLALVPRLPAAPPAELKRLHVVLVFDTLQGDLAPGLKVDRKRVESLLRSNIPPTRLVINQAQILEGNNVSRDKVLALCRSLKVGPDEGVLLYYGGHGGRTSDDKHFLALKNGKLFRSELREALESRKAGLVVILTDCCSNLVKLNRSPDAELVERPFEVVKQIHPTLRDLLFLSRGTVDVTAASNDRAYGDDYGGGVFTQAVCKVLITPHKALVSRLDGNRDGVLTWVEFFPGLKRDTEEVFARWLNGIPRSEREGMTHKPQSPMSFALGTPAATGPEASANQTYCVVGVVNRAGRAVKMDYRWSGDNAWKSLTLEPGGKNLFYQPVASPGGELVLEARIEGISSLARMRSRSWSGQGRPGFADGPVFELKPRK